MEEWSLVVELEALTIEEDGAVSEEGMRGIGSLHCEWTGVEYIQRHSMGGI